MLRENLKQELDQLTDNQLKEIAALISSIKTQQSTQARPFWQRGTPDERVQDLLAWVAQLPKIGITLSDEAFDRGNIYE
ncbi:MAG: hypothetical protein WA902_12500 [Thermosynechococcaceae cyanobacterium]